MKEYWYYIYGILLLLAVAITKAVYRFNKKEILSKLQIAESLLFSLIGGVLAGLLASVYIEDYKLQCVFIAGGSWMGQRILQAIAALVESKIDLIFKNNENEKSK